MPDLRFVFLVLQEHSMRVIPPELLAEGKVRLAEGHYSHLVD